MYLGYKINKRTLLLKVCLTKVNLTCMHQGYILKIAQGK